MAYGQQLFNGGPSAQNTDKTSNKVHHVEQKQLFYGLSVHLGLPECALVRKAIGIASNWCHLMLLLCDMTGVSLCLHRWLLFKKNDHGGSKQLRPPLSVANGFS